MASKKTPSKKTPAKKQASTRTRSTPKGQTSRPATSQAGSSHPLRALMEPVLLRLESRYDQIQDGMEKQGLNLRVLADSTINEQLDDIFDQLYDALVGRTSEGPREAHAQRVAEAATDALIFLILAAAPERLAVDGTADLTGDEYDDDEPRGTGGGTLAEDPELAELPDGFDEPAAGDLDTERPLDYRGER